MIYSIKMILLPKKVFLVFFVVTLCTNLSYADDHDNSNFVEIDDVNTGRDRSLSAASHPIGMIYSNI